MVELALLGGTAAVTHPLPHRVWPPPANSEELAELADQRNRDINIKGKTGPIKAFEEAFLAFMEGDVRYAVTFNSGTSALLAAYMAVGVTDGCGVIGPALTYHAALSPVLTLKGKIVLADVDIDTRCLSPDDIERRITDDTVAITVVHQWGHPCNMDAILEIAQRHQLHVIEDCSHAHGSRYKGRLCGTFGDVAIFSLQAKKAIFAGEGGILVTNDANLHDRAVLAGHYRDRSKHEVNDPELRKYWETGFGLKLRMSPFNAIVARHSLKRFPEVAQNRTTCLEYFNDRLKEIPYLTQLPIKDDVEMGAGARP